MGRRVARIEAEAAKGRPIDLGAISVEDFLAGRLPFGAHEALVKASYRGVEDRTGAR
jgi:hypothetical protein